MRSHSCLLLGTALLGAVSASKWVDCAAGTSYYVCTANGFRGCCSVDACNLAWCPDVGSPAPPPGTGQSQAPPPPPSTFATITGVPPPATATAACATFTRSIADTPRPTDCPAGSTKNRVWFPDAYPVYHDHPDHESPRDGHGNVVIYQDAFNGKVENKRDTVVRFPVPKGAKNCVVGIQMTNIQVNMGYAGSGAYDVLHVKLEKSFDEQFTSGKVSYNGIKNLLEDKKEGNQGDMTQWPETQTDGKTFLSSKEVPCAEDVMVKISLLSDTAPGLTVFGQSNGTSDSVGRGRRPDHGFYLDYDC